MPSEKRPAATRSGGTARRPAPAAKKPARKATPRRAAADTTGVPAAEAGARVAEAPAVAVAEGTTPGARPTPGRTLVIEQYGSGIGCPFRQKRILKSLGLRHPHHRVVRPDNPAVRGMVNAIPHLVRIVEDGRAA